MNWNCIVASLQQVNLTEERDVFVWGLKALGLCTVKSMYAALINNGVRVSRDIWQTKLPMKIEVFMLYLKRGVILTKDNLVKRNWHGNTCCCFCNFNESIQHLFFDCFYAKFLWRSIHMLFGIVVPINMTELYQHWSKLGTKKYNSLLLTTAAALLWAIWITRNEVVFDKCRPKSLLQVLFRGTHWLCQWASLQRHDDLKDQLISAAQHLETSALHFFSSIGWLSQRHVVYV